MECTFQRCIDYLIGGVKQSIIINHVFESGVLDSSRPEHLVNDEGLMSD